MSFSKGVSTWKLTHLLGQSTCTNK